MEWKPPPRELKQVGHAMHIERVSIEGGELRLEFRGARDDELVTLCVRLEGMALCACDRGTPLADTARVPEPDPLPPNPPARALGPRDNAPLARFGGIETKNERFARVLKQLAAFADDELGILFLGETGTGKEHLASAVHRASRRAAGPFHAVNCAAIPAELIESELFGHKKGAFTGAHDERSGAFRSAEGGTLFLDEIGDAPPRVQLALLRALEARCIKPVGTDREVTVDVRLLSATSQNLPELIRRGAFRKDLFYRIADLELTLPPLRERREDLRPLSDVVLANLGTEARLSRQAEALLLRHPFPGNVRELQSVLKRAVALSRGAHVLEAVHFAHLLGEQDGSMSGEAKTEVDPILRTTGSQV
jgi:transcriptional regulator with PAS, ATPase and Fis domain